MKKSELKQLLRLALVSAEAGRIDALGARSDHAKTAERYAELNRQLDAAREALDSVGSKCRGYELKFNAAEAKLRKLGCTLDVDGVNWIDPVPKPEEVTCAAALIVAQEKLQSLGFQLEGGQWLKTAVYAPDAGAEVKPAWPAAPSPSRGWVRGTCVSPPLRPDTLIEYQNFAGQLFTEKAEDVISWNSVSWWRIVRVVGTVITQKADEMLSCRGVAKPNDGSWQRGDSAEIPRDSARVEFIRMDGHTGTRTARGVLWDRVAWWRLAE